MNFDYECSKFRNALIDTINASGMPFTVVLYVLNEISSEVKRNIDAQIEAGMAEEAKEAEAEDASVEENK